MRWGKVVLAFWLGFAVLSRLASGQEELDVTAIAFAPSDTLPIATPGHWWEARIFYAPGVPVERGRLQVRVHQPPKVRSVFQRPFRKPARQAGILRLPLFLPFGALLETRAFGKGGRVIGQDLTGPSLRGSWVVGVLSARLGSVPTLARVLEHRAVFDRLIVAMPTRMNVPDEDGDALASTLGAMGRRTLLRELPLPHHPGCWSGISHLIVEPSVLPLATAHQLTGLVTWLHWGGTLVLSGGPEADGRYLEELASLLPARWEEALLVTLPRRWQGDGEAVQLQARRIKLQPGAAVLARTDQGEPLAVGRSVGRGRVIVLSFDPSDPALERLQGVARMWADLLIAPEVPVQKGVDGARVTRVRYAARDATGPTAKATPARLSDHIPLQHHAQDYLLTHLGFRANWARLATYALLLTYTITTVLLHVVSTRRRRLWGWAMLPVLSVGTAGGIALVAARFEGGWAELVVIEAIPDYEAVHLTRHVSVVTTRRTELSIQFQNRWTLAMAADLKRNATALATLPGLRSFQLDLTPVRLTQLVCYARAPRSIRAEEYLFAPRPYFRLAPKAQPGRRTDLYNDSPWTLRDVVIRTGSRVRYVTERWDSGASIGVLVASAGGGRHEVPSEDAVRKACKNLADPGLAMLYDDLLRANLLESMVIGWLAETPPGIKIERSLQKRIERSIVVVPLLVGWRN